jgi:transketolase
MAIRQAATDPAAREQLCINTIRTLAMDAVQQANSGHPGLPMGAAPMAFVLWTRHLRHNPADPAWPNRDRFVLSAGHGSMLLYALLHLTGYDLPLGELERFRQWGSRTPGHPEHGLTPGVETTTGPLGQGFGNAVGMAIAETINAARFNRPAHTLVDYRVYVIASDGDMMEGVASEAASLAGHLRLGRLIVLYDDNHISIEGDTALAFSEDVPKRFEAYGWHVQRLPDGNDTGAIDQAIEAAKGDPRPSLIAVRTHIAYGSPNKQDTAEAHGAPLGKDEVRLTKRNLDWPEEPPFLVPEPALAVFREALRKGRDLQADWRRRFDAYAREYPQLAAEWTRTMKGDLPEGWTAALPTFSAKDGAMATREASGKVLNAVAPRLPELVGGSADLAPSTNTIIKGGGDYGPGNYGGRNMHFGVREHAMGAIANGMALSGGLIPYVATFLIFSDYMRPTIRLAALMEQRVVYVFTHDSVGLGEDGPTHQPVEQLAALRAIPKLVLVRPADATETAAAWRIALGRRRGPTALALTRQKLPVLEGSSVEGAMKGGYVVADAEEGAPEVVLIGSGSEVSVALAARGELGKEGIRARVVSLPSFELFEAQPAAYRREVLPPGVRARVAVEAAAPFGWDRYVGPSGAVVGLERFGASAPYQTIYEQLGLTAAAVAARAKALLGR